MDTKPILAVLLATIWIAASEFLRNKYIVGHYWNAHYEQMGLHFPNSHVNGAIWGLWSFGLALAIFQLSRQLPFWMCAFWCWFLAFALMWLVTGNLAVLPLQVLPLAIPLSIMEVLIATWILTRVAPNTLAAPSPATT